MTQVTCSQYKTFNFSETRKILFNKIKNNKVDKLSRKITA